MQSSDDKVLFKVAAISDEIGDFFKLVECAVRVALNQHIHHFLNVVCNRFLVVDVGGTGEHSVEMLLDLVLADKLLKLRADLDVGGADHGVLRDVGGSNVLFFL